MFTGLVQAVGRVAELRPGSQSLRLTVDPGSWGHVPARGDSISVSGVCLTVVDVGDGGWAFDVVPETLSKTTIGGLKVGGEVNLEHSATASTLLGGHIVQGHVDGLARVVQVQREGEWRVWFEVSNDCAEYLAPKGSVCVDGVSLTIASLWSGRPEGARANDWPRRRGASGFSVALIPETLQRTTLAGLRVGDAVNLETDTIAKTVVHWLQRFGAAKGQARAQRVSAAGRTPRRRASARRKRS